MLVAAGALPARDERLAALERWIGQAVAAQPDPGHRQILRGYAAWHHLRRLRGRLDGRPASRQQAKTLGIHVQAAIQWQKISAGDWTAYAADVSRRSHTQERAPARDQRADPLPSA
jgi:hypothetical protein